MGHGRSSGWEYLAGANHSRSPARAGGSGRVSDGVSQAPLDWQRRASLGSTVHLAAAHLDAHSRLACGTVSSRQTDRTKVSSPTKAGAIETVPATGRCGRHDCGLEHRRMKLTNRDEHPVLFGR